MKTIKIESLRLSLAAAIKERRQEKELSQQELADMMKTQRQRITEVEAGKTKDIDTYLYCMKALGGRIYFEWQ